MIDRDTSQFTEPLLKQWRQQAEDFASRALGADGRYRAIAASEIRQELTICQLVGVKALEEEFGCHIETELHVPAGDGYLRLDAAAVRGEDLVAIEIIEHSGRGVAYFRHEYLLELCSTLKFPRFRSCVLFFLLISDGPEEGDSEIVARLQQLGNASTVETHVRCFRLKGLLARFNL